MSKKIVIELSPEVAEALVRAAGTGEIVDQIVPQLQGKVERSVIEWHDWGSIPDDGEKVLVKYAKGYIDLDTVVYDELEDDVQWWHFDNGDASKAVAWAYLPGGGEDSLAEV